MHQHLISFGLSLRRRARLQGALRRVQIHSVRTLDELAPAVVAFPPLAVIVDEAGLAQPLGLVLRHLTSHFSGPVLLCAADSHGGDELTSYVRSHHVVKILHHPIDSDELAKAVASELGLPTRIAERREGLPEGCQGWREMVETQLQPLEELARREVESIDARLLSAARQAAHQLAGTLGSLGLDSGGLLAREAENLLAVCPPPLQRLARVVAALRSLVRHHRPEAPSSPWRDGHLLVVSDDHELLAELKLEGLLFHWTVESCQDLTGLVQALEEPGAYAFILDRDSQAARQHPDLIEELLKDGWPCVVLESSPTPPPAHQRWLPKPVQAYPLLVAALSCMTRQNDARPPAILAVDDDPLLLRVVESILGSVDLYVHTLKNPLELWDRLEQVQPDLLLMGVALPPFSGIELCRALRRDARYSALPIVFLSSYNDSETVQKAYEAGADDYLFKPVRSRELITRISNRLERTRQTLIHGQASSAHASDGHNLSLLLLQALHEGESVCLVSLRQDDHDNGPRASLELEHHLRQTVRSNDIIKRLGPCELLLALQGMDRRRTRRRLHQILGRNRQGLHMGLAQFPDDGDAVEKLIESAREFWTTSSS